MGKVVTVGSAIASAVTHAAQVFKGIGYVVNGFYDVFKRVANKIRWVYDSLKGFVKNKFGFVYEPIKKLWDLYNSSIKPVINKLTNSINDVWKAYKTFKAIVTGRLNELWEIVTGPIKKDIQRLAKALGHLYEIMSAFSKEVADKIGKLRKDLLEHTVYLLNEYQNNMMKWTMKYFTPVDKFFRAVDSLKKEHIDPVKAGMEGLRHDLGLVITPEKKPKPEFAYGVGVMWGSALFKALFEGLPEKYEIKPPEWVEDKETEDILSEIAKDEPEELPEEQKEIYDALTGYIREV